MPADTRLLVVEDDLQDVALLRHALGSASSGRLVVDWAASLAEALAHLGSEPVDVVLLDLGLPDSVGLDTLTAVHAEWPNLPVVVLTDLTDDDAGLRAVRSGAQDYVVKGSLDGPQLVRAVRQAAERGRLRAEVDRLARRQRVLAELGRYAVQDPPLPEQLARAAELLRECLDHEIALVLQRRADGRYVVQHGIGPGDLEGELLPALLASQLRHTGNIPAACSDLAALDAPAVATGPPVLREVRGTVVVPLDGMGWSGALALLDRVPRTYDEETLDFLGAVATLLTEAMRRVQAEHDRAERAKELSALAAIGRIVQEPAEASEVLRAVAAALTGGMQFPNEAVARVEVDGEQVISDGGAGDLVEELTAEIVCDGVIRGTVGVGHRQPHGLNEFYEQQLVDAVAETLSLWLERHDTMARTRESEARLRSVLEQMPGIVWTVDTDLRVTGHSGRGHDQLGVIPDETVGSPLGVVVGEQGDAMAAARQALAGESCVYDHVLRGRTFETHVEPLRSVEGHIVGAIAMAVDVTGAKQAERALRRSEERFRRLAENAQDIIYRFVHTDPPHFEYVSPAVEPMFGVHPEELYEDPAIPMRGLAADDRERLLRCISEPQEEPAPFVARVRRPDGQELWVEERHSYVFDDDGRHVATEGVVRDVTARMRIEESLRDGLEQEQAATDALRSLNQMKDAFLTAVSHELRTPLTSLKGLSHTLTAYDEQLPVEQRRTVLERIAANADRLQELLDDLLDIDRLTRGAIQLDLAEVDVASLVTRTLDGVPFNGRTVTTSAEPVTATLDEAKVERIVENMVLNALKHTAADVPVWVSVRSDDGGVSIRVEDAGDGVPEHLRTRILEPFEMGDGPATKVGGLGIGLNIVARFTELHGGTVEVGERDGGGASFRVWLPRTPQGRDGVVAPLGARSAQPQDDDRDLQTVR